MKEQNDYEKMKVREGSVAIKLECHQICEKIRKFIELNEDFGMIYVCQLYEFLKDLEKGS